MPHPPKLDRKAVVAINGGGTGVAEGFTLPWNKTRTLADVWADAREQQRLTRQRNNAKMRQTNAEIRRRANIYRSSNLEDSNP